MPSQERETEGVPFHSLTNRAEGPGNVCGASWGNTFQVCGCSTCSLCLSHKHSFAVSVGDPLPSPGFWGQGGGGGLVAKSCPTLATPWTVACQAPLFLGFSRQEYWSGLPFPSPGDLPQLGIEPRSPALQADSLPTELQGKPRLSYLKWYLVDSYCCENHCQHPSPELFSSCKTEPLY